MKYGVFCTAKRANIVVNYNGKQFDMIHLIFPRKPIEYNHVTYVTIDMPYLLYIAFTIGWIMTTSMGGLEYMVTVITVFKINADLRLCENVYNLRIYNAMHLIHVSFSKLYENVSQYSRHMFD